MHSNTSKTRIDHLHDVQSYLIVENKREFKSLLFLLTLNFLVVSLLHETASDLNSISGFLQSDNAALADRK